MTRKPKPTLASVARQGKKLADEMGGKNPRKPRTPKAAKPAPASNRSVTTEDNDAIRANFLQHRTHWTAAMNKLALAQNGLKEVVSAAKADGFLKKEFQIADELNGSPKQEAKVTGEVTLRLRVARWMGHPMGNQLDLFAQPDRTPAVESAYDAGKQAAMEHKSASPPHDPSTPQYERWLKGFHDEQGRQVREGIKPLNGDGTLEARAEDGASVAAVGPDPARALSDFDDFPGSTY